MDGPGSFKPVANKITPQLPTLHWCLEYDQGCASAPWAGSGLRRYWLGLQSYAKYGQDEKVQHCFHSSDTPLGIAKIQYGTHYDGTRKKTPTPLQTFALLKIENIDIVWKDLRKTQKMKSI
jgi:hypothetical protein